MFRPPAKRVYDWSEHMLVSDADTHIFALPEPGDVAALGPPAFVPTEPRTLAALERHPIFVVPELPALAVPEFMAASRPAPTHPHRRPLRWERARRPGSFPHPPMHCLSPVRRSRAARARGELAP